MFFFLSAFLTVAVDKRNIGEGVKNLTSLLPSVSIQLAGNNLLFFEGSGTGLNWNNINETYKNYKFGTALWSNVISFFIFTILGLYLENVLPTAAGIRKPFWFPFTKSFWFGSTHRNQDIEGEGNKIGHSSDEAGIEDNIQIDLTNFEEIPEQLKRKEDENEYLKILGLKKRFGSNFFAVNNLNVEMYEDQIFALLGHNGAGKTTTINILCGMISKSKGKASIYGYDIETEMNEIRKIMGFCPQHNILFPELTVREHLEIFALFKGMPKQEIGEEIDRIL